MIDRFCTQRRVTLALFSLAVALLLVPASASAQSGRAVGNQFELTPSLGLSFGGEYQFIDPEFGFTEYGVESSESWGLTFGIPVGRRFQIELMYLNQDTELEIERGVGVLLDNDVELEFYHVGFLWQGNQGQIRPFFVLSAGATRIEPGITRFAAETEPSVSFGGGAKIMFSEHMGLRLDGRLLVTALDAGFDRDHRSNRCCRRNDLEEEIVQGRASVGLIFSF